MNSVNAIAMAMLQHSTYHTKLLLSEAGAELAAVETQLKRHKVGAESMKGQLELLKNLCMDVSEPSPELITKLNCDLKGMEQTPFGCTYVKAVIIGRFLIW